MGWLARLGIAATVAALLGGATGAPVAAQTPTTAPPVRPAWLPPPVNMAALPPDTPPGPPPNTQYQQKYQCIISEANNATLPDQPPAQAMLDIRTAQQFATGKGVSVAVIDTGVNPNPFLTDHGRLRGGGDYVAPSATSNGTTDCDGHGTLTAGIIAANTAGTENGFIGVAPQATIYAIRQTSTVYQEAGSNGITAGTPSTLATAIVHAVNLHVNVITMSLNTCLPTEAAVQYMNTPDSPEQQLQAALAYAVQHDVVVVNSAGNVTSQPENGQQQANNGPCANIPQNNNPDPNSVNEIEIPSVYSDDLLSVASVDPTTGAVSNFSVWGPWVNIAAPGQAIVSVNPAVNGTGLAATYSEPGSNQQPGQIQGTSFAAPYVAGVVALVRERFPNLSARQVIERIEATAQHPSGPGGRNNQIGYGIVNPVAALTALLPGQNGVPSVSNRSVPAVLPHEAAKDWAPIRVALIGSAVALALFFGTLFVVRTKQRRRRSDL